MSESEMFEFGWEYYLIAFGQPLFFILIVYILYRVLRAAVRSEIRAALAEDETLKKTIQESVKKGILEAHDKDN